MYDELIKELDTSDVRSSLLKIKEQIYAGLNVSTSIMEEVNKIVVCGVGKDATSGHILKQYLHEFHMPVFVNEDFELFDFVDKETLVFVVSSGGETEETLSMYRLAVKSGAKVISLGNGGKLKEISDFNKTKYLQISGEYAYFFSMLQTLENSKIVPEQKEDTAKLYNSMKTDFEGMGRNLASKITGKIPAIFSSNKLAAAGFVWKQCINDVSRINAAQYVFPKAVYHEFNLADNYVIILRDEKEHPRISFKMDNVKKSFKEKDVQVIEIGIRGDCYLTRIYSAILIGVWTSYYLAIMNETNPKSSLNL